MGETAVAIAASISRPLSDKDWYFDGPEAAAVERADAKARQWELLCTNWDKTERPFLELYGEPLPHEPRWPTSTSREARGKLAPEVLQALRREGTVEPEEFAQALAEFSLAELIPVYKGDRADDLKNEDVQNSTVSKGVSQMNQEARFLPGDVPAVRLTAEHFRTAKQRMLRELGRRTVATICLRP